MKFENKGKWLNKMQESAQKNEADYKAMLKKDLNDLYKGIGWSELDYFIDGLTYTAKVSRHDVSVDELIKLVNASGIAKVKAVKDIKNSADMEDFDPKDFNANDKIIVTKKPMSGKFYGEAEETAFNVSISLKSFANDPKKVEMYVKRLLSNDFTVDAVTAKKA